MSAISLARETNPAVKRGHGLWLGIRSLIAELAAFPVRISSISGNLIVSADLPGLRKDEVSVDLTDSLLVIEATPNREQEAFFRRAGRRVVPLPNGARIHRAKAQLKDGILTVTLPVSSFRNGRTLSVEEVIGIPRP
jgi:HSP20 family molecular chaperone IbpA